MSCGVCVEFKQKLGSLLPTREFTLDLPESVDLAAATTINFVWRARGGTGRNVIAMTTTDAAARIVTVDLTSGAVAAIGVYEFQFEITIAGKTLIIPEDGFYYYEVTATMA
jgi:hypothetical protein